MVDTQDPGGGRYLLFAQPEQPGSQDHYLIAVGRGWLASHPNDEMYGYHYGPLPRTVTDACRFAMRAGFPSGKPVSARMLELLNAGFAPVPGDYQVAAKSPARSTQVLLVPHSVAQPDALHEALQCALNVFAQRARPLAWAA